MLACRVLGHRFRTDGPVLRWACERGCGGAGAERRTPAVAARRHARASDREDLGDLGRRPLLSLLPRCASAGDDEQAGPR